MKFFLAGIRFPRITWQTVLCFVLFSFKAQAQMINASNYPMTIYNNVPLENMTGATVIHSAGVGSTLSASVKLGLNFTFCLAGFCSDSVKISTQGSVRLGNGISIPSPYNSLYSVDISPLSNMMSTGTNGFVSYKLMGTAPNRKFVVHWKVHLMAASVTFAATDEFQLALYENGRIDFNYGNMPASWAGSNTFNERSYQAGFNYKLLVGQPPEQVMVDVVSPNFNSSVAMYGANYFYNRELIPNLSRLSFLPDSTKVNAPLCAFGNIGTACVELLITDTTHNEKFFDVYRTTVNANQLLKRIYTNTAGTGQVYFVKDSSLASANNYSYTIVAGNYSSPPATVFMYTTTTLPQLSGVKTIPGNYTSITEALSDIRCRQISSDLVLELGSGYTTANEKFPIVIDNTLWTGPSKKLTIRPAPGVTALAISNPGPNPLMQLSNAQYFSVDGRPGGTGTLSVLALRNDTSAANVIQVSGGSQYNTFRNCIVNGKGRYDLLQQTLVFIDSISNSYNKFLSCEFSPSSATNWVETAIISNGSFRFPNTNNDITSCSFINCGSNALKTWFTLYNPIKIVELRKGNSVWNLEGNSFYCTDTMKAMSNMFYIYVNSPRGDNFLIRDNWFGGKGPKCSGTKMPVTVNNAGLKFISLTAGDATYSVIRKNRIANIGLTGTNINGNCCYNFDFIESGCNRIVIDSNLVGDTLSNSSIVYSYPANNYYPIDLSFISAKPGANTITNGPQAYYIRKNAAGGLKLDGKFSFTGISLTNYQLRDEVFVTDNFIGGRTDSSIFAHADIVGIYGASAGEDSILVLNNTIRNLCAGINTYTSSGVGKIAGIFFGAANLNTLTVSYAGLKIAENKLYNFRDNNDGQSNNTGISSALGGIVGIRATMTGGTVLIENNNIHSFHNVDKGAVQGISTSSFQNPCFTKISRNFIHNIYLDKAPGEVHGIFTYMNAKIDNNMIALGSDENGLPVFNQANLMGIKVYHRGADSLEMDHNSINISGGTQNIQYGSGSCINVQQNVQGNYYNVKLRNNILSCDRFGQGHNYIVQLPQGWPVNTIFKCDYNQYYAGGTANFMDWGYSFPAWQAATGFDAHSYFAPPMFVNPNGNAQTCDLHLQFANNSESKGTNIGMPYDFDNDNRLALTPVDIGADAGNFHALPMISLGPDTTLCLLDSITAPGTYSLYSWNTGATTPYIKINAPGFYKLTITDALGYTSSDSINVTAIRPKPLVSAGPDLSVCAGSQVTLTATGSGTTYVWDNGISNGVPFTPTSTANYIVVAQSTNSCINRDTVSVSVNPLPLVNASADKTVCAGTSVTLTATGATMLTWNNTVVNGVGFVPQASSAYIVTGTDANNCSNTDTMNMTVNPLPFIDAGPDKVVCQGTSVVLAGNGAASFTWNNNVVNGVPFIPSATLDYIVTGTDANSCSDQDTMTVFVDPLPTVSVSPPFSTVCNDDGLRILTGGTPPFGVWSGPGVNAATFNPGQAGVGTHQVAYSYTNASGCVGNASASLKVDLCTSISTLQEFIADIRLYPNPASSVLVVVSQNELSKLVISDETGKEVMTCTPGNKKAELNIASLSKGIYIVTMYSGNTVYHSKFTKN